MFFLGDRDQRRLKNTDYRLFLYQMKCLYYWYPNEEVRREIYVIILEKLCLSLNIRTKLNVLTNEGKKAALVLNAVDLRLYYSEKG